jgi:hypothetical protein
MITDRHLSTITIQPLIVKTLIVLTSTSFCLAGCDRSPPSTVSPEKETRSESNGEGEKPLFGSLVRPALPTTTAGAFTGRFGESL